MKLGDMTFKQIAEICKGKEREQDAMNGMNRRQQTNGKKNEE